MALITPAAIAALHTSLSLKFQGGYSSAKTFWDKVATEIPSSTTSNTYGWMQQVDSMRQWVGPRVIRDLAGSAYQLTNLPFELTLGVDRHDWEDENTGIYTIRAEQMGQAAAKWPDEQVAAAVWAGRPAGAGLCFDGLTYFNANHTLNPAAVQTNTNTLALTAGAYETVRAAMMGFVGETGRSLGVVPDTLFVVPQLEATAKRILQADFIADAIVATASTVNVNKGTAQLVVSPELGAISGSTTAWILADCSKPIKPFIWQLRQPATFSQITSPDAFTVMMLRQYIWGVEGRGAAGYGPWWLAYLGNV